MDIETMINGCCVNDRIAQKALYERYFPIMFKVCLRYVLDYDDAMDILHDVFMKVFRNITKYRHIGSFEGWLKKICINTCVNWLRDNKPRLQSIDLEETFDVPLEKPIVFDNLSIVHIVDVINKLPDKLKTILVLRGIKGYKYKEIVELLSISEVSCRKYYNMAKERVLQLLQQE